MDDDSRHPPSFSTVRRWGIFFSVIISMVAVSALMVMANYLSSRYYVRQLWTRQIDQKLSLRTIALLKSITNRVNVIIYYDKTEPLYQSVNSLLVEYQNENPKISVRTVDYLRSFGEAQTVKAAYHLGSGQEKNVVIFDCNGRQAVVMESELGDYAYAAVPSTNSQPAFEKQLKAFDGESRFSSALVNVMKTKARKAYFLQGAGEHELDSTNSDGYQQFGELLEENGVTPEPLRLTGTNDIPADCSLLVIAGPREPIPTNELAKVKLYVDQGGRLLALFNFYSIKTSTGLEGLLKNWNVRVGKNVVDDPDYRVRTEGLLQISGFNLNHPISKSFDNAYLLMVQPRTIETENMHLQGPEDPKAVPIIGTSTNGVIDGFHIHQTAYVGIAVKKENIQGVYSDRGTTALVVLGDSLFLSNQIIDQNSNRDFGAAVVNWLLEQYQLLDGVGPHPIKEYKLEMTAGQFRRVSWIFLGAMPGGILVFGGLVWLRRRH